MRVRPRPCPEIRLAVFPKDDVLCAYHPYKNVIYLCQKIPEEYVIPCLVHELTHWAMDMCFTLKELIELDKYMPSITKEREKYDHEWLPEKVCAYVEGLVYLGQLEKGDLRIKL
jgi:hypothetical protein